MAILNAARARLATAMAAGVCLLAAVTVSAQSTPAIEANIKAVFLFNFAKYVTWPSVAIGERSPAEIRICVTENNAFFGLLKAAVQDEDVEGKPLVAVALSGLDEARTCQILYVGNSQGAEAKAWYGAVRRGQVLTVADGALTDDTVIAFVRDENRIRFDINRAAAARYNLNISSKLLRLARRVRDR